MNKIFLKSGREKSLLRRHPWIFSGAIAKINGHPELGETVEICDSKGRFVARGAYSPESQIRIRVWSWNQNEIVNSDFFLKRLNAAISARSGLFIDPESPYIRSGDIVSMIRAFPSAVRLVNAESDCLPGFIVDRYGKSLVLQFLSAGAERWRQTLLDLLLELSKFERVYERSDVDVRKLEGLPSRAGTLVGKKPEKINVEENDLNFVVDIVNGHKTGLYLDQRVNRKIVQEISRAKEVLDCFSYSGGFTIHALAGGAKFVTAIDRSRNALEQARENLRINAMSGERVDFLEADVFNQLRKFRDEARQFDIVILDPPKFAPTTSHVQRAARAYKDINLLALKLLRSGGILVTFSCSGGIDRSLFRKIIAGSALDAGVDAQIIQHLEQSPDHPVSLSFPESAYLKGLVLRVQS
jgi:23S rRNA (cytosine1962-C5)-methyltransferase